MKHKPVVCLIDEDENVRLGWSKALGQEATLVYFQDHLELLNHAARDKSMVSGFSCIIIGRFFKQLNLDVVMSEAPDMIRKISNCPLFLNWQGYITKDEVLARFDGKLFHRYGVKWQTLRMRVQKFEKTLRTHKKSPEAGKMMEIIPLAHDSKPEKCCQLLRTMAKNAAGPHKEKIEFYAQHDHDTGTKLLEAIYNRLLTDKNRPSTCPSRYINSSPVIAQRILHDALFGA